MMIKSNSYAKQISDAQTMVTALEANLEALKRRGMTDEFINSLGNSLNDTLAANSDQERLKGELKAATAALDAAKLQLHDKMVEATKVVKLEMPQAKWIEFGITSKR